ncbi:glycoside hydrolase [Ktedonosporobacter rubrisoli]|uniref:Glycoside hydrolase n=1 Tax=Ktedonosporobacter rubrisoli TaxID=2509675 RepID=A0A4P6JSC4_KTERU|nr:glycoside hydrolase [Ktedonosporobacter rubrisoli]QBD78235.1 glycoside hydrolase [Ktedonosporobacter rubrisoli]
MTISTQPNSVAEREKKPARRAKITIIGGGSPYCAGLMQSIVHNADSLRGSHITLMDINREGLELIYTIGSKLFKHAGIDITLERTTDREEAISDADFVITTFRTGGLQARRLDEKIPLRHGMIGQETVGPGGFFYALRSIPVVAGIATEIEKLAPKAFLLNYTNPSNIVTEAVAHHNGIRIIGMCDGPVHEIPQMAELAGLNAAPGKRLYYRTLGLNHGNWTTAVWRDGIDVLPQIVAWSQEYTDAHPEWNQENYEQAMIIKLTAQYGAIPSHYLHYYYFPDKVLEFLHKKPTSRSEDIMAMIPDILAHYKEEAKKDVPHLTKVRGGNGGFGDFALDVLCSILNDTGEEWVLNVPNNGSINFLANDRVVELPCRVDARGAMPLAQGDGGIAVEQRGLLSLLAEYEGATARAALWGNRRDAIKALASNPLVLSYSKAEEVYDEMAAAHAQYLPERLLK